MLKNKLQAIRYKLGPKYRKSYSQCGEDIIIARLLRMMNIAKPFYIDIGANDPVIYSNTYLFYTKGARGILVEPNPELCKKMARKRPGDVCIQTGVGGASGVKDFYVLSNDAISTFSKEEADSAMAKGYKLVRTVSLPIRTLNDIATEQDIKSVDILSVDVEGLDAEILGSIDFSKLRPKIICVETKSYDGSKTAESRSSIAEMMSKNGYVIRGQTPINSIYADLRVATVE